jgi:hypothetical protein
MKYFLNSLKVVLVCAVINTIYTYYMASSSFMAQAMSAEKDMGRFQLFMHYSEITENFWPHIISGWFHGFGLSLISCSLVLLWVNRKTHNNASHLTDADNAPSS